MRRIHLVLFVLSISLFAAVARGQVATGTPPFGSFSGGPFDVVNNGNLNVHFSIPVESKAGRGLPFNYNLTYDTSVWYPVGSSGSQSWQPVNNWGWSNWTAAQTGYMYYSQLTNYCTFWTGYNWQTAPNETTIYNFIYFDKHGASHAFPGQNVYWSNIGHGCPSGTNSYDTNAEATDGSGYIWHGDTWSLTPPDGKTFNPPYQAQTGAGSVSDPNGNTISNTTGGVFTDTLSTTTLTVAGSGTPSSPMTFQYTSANGTGTVTVKYTSYTVRTNFGCSGVSEFGPTTENLVSEIDMPDVGTNTGDKYTFTYEVTPGYSGDVTGRLASVTLPTGGTISYAYSGGSNGIECSDGSTAGLTRVTPDSSTGWAYSRSLVSGSEWKTTLTDPNSNTTTYYFQSVTPSGSTTTSFFETERDLPSTTDSETIYTCYNGSPKSCKGTTISLPITRRTVWTTLGSNTSEVDTYYDTSGYGLPTEVDQYDWGQTLARKTLTTYGDSNCGVTNANVIDRPCSVKVEDGSSNVVASTSYTYDGNGNLTTETPSVGPQQTFSYNSNGTLATSNDGAGTTTYSYNSASCNAFPYSVSPPTGPSASLAWNCNGGVMTSSTDGNSQITSFIYDNMNRVTHISYPNSGSVDTSYSPTQIKTTTELTSSINRVQTTDYDGLGRVSSQTVGSVTTTTSYNSLGQIYKVSTNNTNAVTTYQYDANGRVMSVSDAGGGSVAFSYTSNDVLRTLSPAPSREYAKKVQYEYDGLGRLTSVCEITSSITGHGSCGQTSAQTGLWTKYSYSALNEMTGVTQNAQSASYETRSYTFDALGRLTKEMNPESGTDYYYYDSDGTCGTSQGDMVKKVDAMGNVTCFHYDAVHRLTSITYPSGTYSGVTPAKHFVYDGATVNGHNMADAEGRLAEAYTCTGSCSSKITDFGYGYDGRGNISDIYESTPNSGGYYHVKATYYPGTTTEYLNFSKSSGLGLIPQITYTPTDTGQPYSAVAGSGQNPLSSVNYNAFGEPTTVSFGSSDSDNFTYDSNTGRMTQYNFKVNGSSDSGTLTWNANGTLQKLAISDALNSADSQTCTYAYDDLARLDNDNCGSTWSQSFSDGAFGNVSKSGSISFGADYNLLNQVSVVGGFSPTYDADGNTLSDPADTYGWDTDGNMIKAVTLTATTNVTYDAMDRAVEFEVGSAYTQIVYGPGGGKFALMNGQTLIKAFVPLAAGAVAVYTPSGLAYYRHADWLGSSRLASTPSRGVYYDGAYAPYGENYAESGTTDRSFTGQDQDMVSSSSYPLYDFTMREYNATWGRWISPDPAGLAAVNPMNPQTWNRYAYVGGNPMSFVDPLGLYKFWAGDCEYDTVSYYVDGKFDSSETFKVFCRGWYTAGQLIPPSLGGSGGGASGNLQALPLGKINCDGPAGPPDVSVDNNMKSVELMVRNSQESFDPAPFEGSIKKVSWMYTEFATGGPQDYKTQFGRQYADFGNFNYGAVCGAAGFSLSFCQSAAGLGLTGRVSYLNAEYKLGLRLRPPVNNGAGFPFLLAPYGDQPSDSSEIAKGYAYFKNGC